MVDFKGAVVVVTGAAGGIGFALAKAAQARGASLVIADIREDALARAEAVLARDGEVLPAFMDEASQTQAQAIAMGRATARNPYPAILEGFLAHLGAPLHRPLATTP